jgi:hypothetical protein
MAIFKELMEEQQKQEKSVRGSKMNTLTAQKDEPTSVIDVSSTHHDITTAGGLHKDTMIKVVKSLSTASISTFGTPVRLNTKEKKEIEDFILIKLRSKGLEGKGISMGKLMRYALRYMIKAEEKAFTECLIEALKKNDDIE